METPFTNVVEWELRHNITQSDKKSTEKNVWKTNNHITEDSYRPNTVSPSSDTVVLDPASKGRIHRGKPNRVKRNKKREMQEGLPGHCSLSISQGLCFSSILSSNKLLNPGWWSYWFGEGGKWGKFSRNKRLKKIEKIVCLKVPQNEEQDVSLGCMEVVP